MIGTYDQKIIARLKELLEDASNAGTRTRFRGWLTSARHLMKSTIGESVHTEEFEDVLEYYADSTDDLYEDSYNLRQELSGILQATLNDLESGLLFKTSLLVSAENFDDLLQQAEHLLSQGFKDPAAVLAGSVLEVALRRLCQDSDIEVGDRDGIEAMNVALSKASAYPRTTQKMITTLADVRNNAAHGKYDQYDEHLVQQLIVWTRGFIDQRFGQVNDLTPRGSA